MFYIHNTNATGYSTAPNTGAQGYKPITTAALASGNTHQWLLSSTNNSLCYQVTSAGNRPPAEPVGLQSTLTLVARKSNSCRPYGRNGCTAPCWRFHASTVFRVQPRCKQARTAHLLHACVVPLPPRAAWGHTTCLRTPAHCTPHTVPTDLTRMRRQTATPLPPTPCPARLTTSGLAIPNTGLILPFCHPGTLQSW